MRLDTPDTLPENYSQTDLLCMPIFYDPKRLSQILSYRSSQLLRGKGTRLTFGNCSGVVDGSDDSTKTWHDLQIVCNSIKRTTVLPTFAIYVSTTVLLYGFTCTDDYSWNVDSPPCALNWFRSKFFPLNPVGSNGWRYGWQNFFNQSALHELLLR